MNRYLSRTLMINSGQFWRCAHGYTLFTDSVCWRCALRRPFAALLWHSRR